MTTSDHTPVFVDPSGRRRRVLRVLIVVAVAGVLGYLALLVVALSGGPVKPSSLLPIPVVDAPATTTTTTTPAPTTTEVTEPVAERRTTTTTEVPTTVEPPAGPPTDVTKPGNGRTDPPGASHRPTPPGKG